MGNEWQTVPSTKDKRKRVEPKAKPAEAKPDKRFADPASAALARFDAEWATQQQGEADVQQAGDQARAASDRALGLNGGAFSGLQVSTVTVPCCPSTHEFDSSCFCGLHATRAFCLH